MSDTRFPNAGVIRKRQLKRNFSDKEIVSGFSKRRVSSRLSAKSNTPQRKIGSVQRSGLNITRSQPSQSL